ncbi:MAG TPA: NAD-dependent epimerase/dehydratase family protein [Anaerolineae bacterium]|nr:NAD-dependent epimerase/dehydratase family protein [Anaerolineae bacterium]
MRALITGGAGFIGSHLSEALLAGGDTVTIIDDLSSGSLRNIQHLTDHPGFRCVVDSITSEAVMDLLIADCDIVYHLAAAVGVEMVVSHPLRTLQTNVSGSEIVLRLADKHASKVLLASTSEVYGKSSKIPFQEEDDRVLGPTTRTRWCYAASKAIDEFLALAYHRERGLAAVIVRLFNTVGPRQSGRYGMVIPRFVRQALSEAPITVYGDGLQSRCFADVSDVVGGLVTLSRHPDAPGQVFNIGSTEEVTVLELAHRVRALTGCKSEIVLVPYNQAYGEGFEDMRRRVPDLRKISSLIGYRPTFNLDQILQRVIDHERQSAPIDS